MKPGESLVSPNAVDVTPGYFEAMGVRLVRGRFFEDGDGRDSLPVVIVDEKLAEQVGADGYLSKAHGLDALGEKVDELVESIIW